MQIKKRNRVGKSGVMGVVFCNHRKKYLAYLGFNTPSKKYIHLHLGYYDTIEEAEQGRINYIKSLI